MISSHILLTTTNHSHPREPPLRIMHKGTRHSCQSGESLLKAVEHWLLLTEVAVSSRLRGSLSPFPKQQRLMEGMPRPSSYSASDRRGTLPQRTVKDRMEPARGSDFRTYWLGVRESITIPIMSANEAIKLPLKSVILTAKHQQTQSQSHQPKRSHAWSKLSFVRPCLAVERQRLAFATLKMECLPTKNKLLWTW